MSEATTVSLRKGNNNSRFWWYLLSAAFAFGSCITAIIQNGNAGYEMDLAARDVRLHLSRLAESQKTIVEGDAAIGQVMKQLRRGEGSFALLWDALRKRYPMSYDMDRHALMRFQRLASTLDSVALVRLVEKEPSYFERLPRSSRTPAVVMAAGRYASLSEIPVNDIDAEMAELYVSVRPYNLRYVPNSLMTTHIATLAVQGDAALLRDIPDSVQTKELCAMAVSAKPATLCDCRFDLRSFELSRLALQEGNEAAECVPKKFFLSKLP